MARHGVVCGVWWGVQCGVCGLCGLCVVCGVWGVRRGRAEQSRAEPSRTEQSRAEPKIAQQGVSYNDSRTSMSSAVRRQRRGEKTLREATRVLLVIIVNTIIIIIIIIHMYMYIYIYIYIYIYTYVPDKGADLKGRGTQGPA